VASNDTDTVGRSRSRSRGNDRRKGDRRHHLSRRAFLGLGAAGIASLVAPLAGSSRAHAAPRSLPPPIKPPRLQPGDTVGLINPPRIPPRPDDVEGISARLRALDLHVRAAGHALDPAASDEQRAHDINELFADSSVKALMPLRGGWGSARVLPHIDYELVRRNPKVVMGYSDVVALLLALRARTGLVTFHGPMGVSPWEPFTVQCARELLFDGRRALLCNPAGEPPMPVPVRTLWPGHARGPLVGGNLTVMSSMLGSPYFEPEDAILFVEEVQEPLSEVDRMLTQLEQAGVLERARGFVFGQCTGCLQPGLDPSLTLDRVLDERIRPLGIPAWSGAAFGHIDRQFVVPIGVPAEIDAERGTIQLIEPAVV
jgi:muramoyltetrapeptide carboxypeptidase